MIDAQKRLGEYGYTFLFEKDKSKLDIMILDYEKRAFSNYVSIHGML